MMKAISKIFTAFAAVAFVCTAFADDMKEGLGKIDNSGKKTLVVYYSVSGNTEGIAKQIQSKLNCDIKELETKEAYPSDYEELTKVAKEQLEKDTTPELKEDVDVSNYDIVFVGTPVWWSKMAVPVKAFLKGGNFSGKTIIPFITHGGSGRCSIPEDMRETAKDVEVLEPLVVSGSGGANTTHEIDAWLVEDLGFLKNTTK
ncbi:MAG: flavodoxin [Alphaproteobacteria bacterium]|nr:flavodoxin [Alphaproteobacteria bacterium]